MNAQPNHELPRQIERCLAALSRLYAKRGMELHQRLVVNAQVRVHEAWTYDNLDGGIYGHAVFLAIPEPLYLDIVDRRDEFQRQLRADLNSLHNVPNEYFDEVRLELQSATDTNWRQESGLLRPEHYPVPQTDQLRIWGQRGYRVFLSHKAEVKKQAANLKAQLGVFGVSCFVAHTDIHPTKEWQVEIEHALQSMDAFVALMTRDFHDSFWTDQEVGYAFGRGVPIISLRLGSDPYGFIGKFQALSCTWESAPAELIRLLLEHPGMTSAYIDAVCDCESFDDANTLAAALPAIRVLTDGQAEQLVKAYSGNSQVHGSFGFNGTKPYSYGEGLAAHLTRIMGRRYVTSGTGIKAAPE